MVAELTDEYFDKIRLDGLPPIHTDAQNNQLEILAGPILRFWGLGELQGRANAKWSGSVTYVTRDSKSSYEELPPFRVGATVVDQLPFCFAKILGVSFWRFDIDIETSPENAIEVSYCWGNEHRPFSFWVPSQNETMRTMFYTCNGFSLAVDPANFPGQLWSDVLAKHKDQPFHVMLGGGDQLYCDSINLVLPEGTLHNLGPLKNAAKMRDFINQFYLRQYIDWYGRGHWRGKSGETRQSAWVEALAQIPSLNIYDDHDIIDGYGTYRDSTMSSPIFEILGELAYTHYMLFQQNVAPPVSSVPSGAKNSSSAKHGSRNAAANQSETSAGASATAFPDADAKHEDPAWITTGKPGPFIHRPAMSLYARLGRSAAFIGLDCRTERKKTQVCAPDTYDRVFERLAREIAQSNGEIKHIYLMLGVPIAYPRMVWAENLMSSRLIGPIKWLSKHKIMFKGLVNPFDGDVELLDDLNDHWTAKHHKRERNHFLRRLVNFQRDQGIRITILSGDVHLCAVGVFQSVRRIAPEKDHHFMVCPVSSAIVNTPPPMDLADFLNHRNRTHILDVHIAERMTPIFNTDTNGERRNQNNTLMARRNYCILEPVLDSDANMGKQIIAGPAWETPHDHQKHPSRHAKPVNVVPQSIRMLLQVERDNKESTAATVPYEMYIPPLQR